MPGGSGQFITDDAVQCDTDETVWPILAETRALSHCAQSRAIQAVEHDTHAQIDTVGQSITDATGQSITGLAEPPARENQTAAPMTCSRLCGRSHGAGADAGVPGDVKQLRVSPLLGEWLAADGAEQVAAYLDWGKRAS